MSPTRDDVARRAGVSSATVSRALNSPSLVAPGKLKRIEAAARALGYVPDKNASALRRSGTGTILFLERRDSGIGVVDRMYATFYADIVRGVADVVDASMYRLMHYRYSTVSDLRALCRHPVADGIVWDGPPGQEELDVLRKARVPFVVCRQLAPQKNDHCVAYVDEREGGQIAGAALVQAGCTSPCHITGSLSQVPVCRARWEGVQEAFAGRSVALHDGALGIRGGWDSAQALLPQIRNGRFDSLFVVNDLTAVGVVQALVAAGVRIPDDISVIGYDNLPFIQSLPIRLTTVDLNIAHAYRQGAQRLLQYMRDSEPFCTAISPALVPGDSVRSG